MKLIYFIYFLLTSVVIGNIHTNTHTYTHTHTQSHSQIEYVGSTYKRKIELCKI